MDPTTPATASPRPPDDETLVARIQAGDRDALGLLFERHASRVRRLLVSIMGPGDDVDDLLQEVFLGVHRAISGFRGNARFTTWLHRITVNTAMSALRRPRRLVAVPSETLAERPDLRADTESVAQGRAMVRRLYAILDTLTPKRRVAFTLFELEGSSIAEVARATGVTVPVAKSRIFFARRELMKKAREDETLAPLAEELRR